MSSKLIKCMDGIWNSGTSQGEGWSYVHFATDNPTHFFVFYTRDNNTGVPIHISAQATESEAYKGDGLYTLPAFVWIDNTPTAVGTAELKVHDNQKIDLLGLLCDFTAWGQTWQIRERMIDCTPMQNTCPVDPGPTPPPGGGFPPYTSKRLSVINDEWSSVFAGSFPIGPRIPFPGYALSTRVENSVLVADCLSIKFTATDQFEKGLIGQNPGSGNVRQWFSVEPAGDPLPNGTFSFNATWKIPSAPDFGRAVLTPGQSYHLNVSFTDSDMNPLSQDAVNYYWAESNPLS